MISHILKMTGKRVGMTTTDGIYIDGTQIFKGDMSGPQSAQMVLQNPTVDYAVLETARGGLLRSGLGFDRCDISVVTNVAADHLGLGGVETLQDLARVKAVVANWSTSRWMNPTRPSASISAHAGWRSCCANIAVPR
jgi:cyanophycin synthetase